VSTRDDLAAVIGTSVHAGNHIRFDITGDRAWFDDSLPRDLADAILAAGWRPPARTVGTVEELRSLPLESVVIESDGTVWRRKDDHNVQTNWRGTHGGRATHYALLTDGPVTLIHEGGPNA
jgi:hypothetical protein